MKEKLSVVEVKARLSEYLREVEVGGSFMITRNGKPVAAMVPAADLDLLRALQAAGPQAGLAGIAGGWEGSEELVEILEASPRSSRPTPEIE